MSKIRLGAHSVNLPGNRLARIAIGTALILGGIVGFLPIVGFWMIPLGLIVLSVDLPAVRRWRRKWTIKLGNWLERKHPELARRIGFRNNPERRGKAAK